MNCYCCVVLCCVVLCCVVHNTSVAPFNEPVSYQNALLAVVIVFGAMLWR